MNLTTRYAILDLFPADKPILGVEIGTDCGINASELLRLYPNLWLWTVDPFLTYEEFTEPGRGTALRFYEERVGPYVKMGRTQHLHMKSVDAAWKLLNDNVVPDFVYIDGEHTTKAVTEDLEAWYPLLRDGGLMAGHDFESAQVHTPVIHFAKKFRLDLNIINEHGGPDMGDTKGSGYDAWGGWAHPTWWFFKSPVPPVAPTRLRI